MRRSVMKGACKRGEFSSPSIAIPRMKSIGPRKSWSVPAARIFPPPGNPPREPPSLTRRPVAHMAERIIGVERKVCEAFLSFPDPMQLFLIRIVNGHKYVEG